MPTYLLLLEFIVCGWCILSDTVDHFTRLSMPSHGGLCDFLQKSLWLKSQNLLWMLTESIKAFAIYMSSCTSIYKILNFFQIMVYFQNCTVFHWKQQTIGTSCWRLPDM